MILRILNTLFNFPARRLQRMPFREVNVLFNDYSTLKVTRMLGQRNPRNQRQHFSLRLEHWKSQELLNSFLPESQITEDEVPFPINAIEDIVPALNQIGPAEWLHMPTGEVLDLDDVIAEYNEQLPFGLSESRSVDPAWLEDIRGSIPVQFIDTERLTYSPTDEPRSWRPRQKLSKILARANGEAIFKQISAYGSAKTNRIWDSVPIFRQDLSRQISRRAYHSSPFCT